MHRIQLKGPWEYQPLVGLEATVDVRSLSPGDASAVSIDQHLPPPGTVKFPASWNEFLGDFRGTVQFRRPFNRPTNLSPSEQVNLVLEGVGGAAEVRLNGQLLGCVADSEGSSRFEITPHLRPHNDLRISISRTLATPDPAGLWGIVCLEILESGKIGGKLADLAPDQF
ncbi:MAG: glycoside hydrolase family 2 sugar binding protein [Planctomycetaceae bacterium]|nr:glycoside hydrolase family 2 sugar binding protein [Planctomycetaceae bacterium]